MFKSKFKGTVINSKALYFHLTYGHTHNIYFAHKLWVNKTFGRTNHKGSKKMWVAKNKIIYVIDILSSQVETPNHGTWTLDALTHDEKKAYVSRVGT